MGKIAKVVYEKSYDPEAVRQKNQVFIDLCENIHLHYRDLRLEFSLDEFRKFFELMKSAENGISYRAGNPEAGNWREGRSHKLKKQWRWTVPAKPDYFPGRFRIELQVNGTYHIHYGNFRFEMNKEEFDAFALGFDRARKEPPEVDRHSIFNFHVTVMYKEDRKFKPVRVYETPFYQSLAQNDRSIYDEYRDLLSTRRGGHCCTWEEYWKLIDSIQTGGWEHDSRVTLQPDSLVVRGGHHRISALLHLYGNIPMLVNNNKARPIL